MTSNAPESFAIRAIILDYGMVLCHTPTDAHVDRVSQFFGVDHHTFWRHYDKDRLSLDRGDVNPDDFWTDVAKDAGLSTRLDPTMLAKLKSWDIEMWMTLNEPMLDWVERLHAAGYKLGLLSNLHQEFARHLRDHAAWLRHFHVPVFSAEVRRVKPEPEIYRHILEKLAVPASAALFIDDRQSNIEAARHEGIHSLLFNSVHQLRSDLSAISFSPLP